MGKLVLVTGGARSGKSSFAEEFVKKFGNDVLYIATATPFDDEMKFRIRKHRDRRCGEWETLEMYRGFDILTEKTLEKSAIMLDCITVMISNLMFNMDYDWENVDIHGLEEVETQIKFEIDELLRVIKYVKIPVVVVTNELGMGIVPGNILSRAFSDIAGRINQVLATAADEVYFCVSGIPIKIK